MYLCSNDDVEGFSAPATAAVASFFGDHSAGQQQQFHQTPQVKSPLSSPPFGFPVKVSKTWGSALSYKTVLIGHRFLRSTHAHIGRPWQRRTKTPHSSGIYSGVVSSVNLSSPFSETNGQPTYLGAGASSVRRTFQPT